MDINCRVILEGTPLPVVGRQIFEEIVAVASGQRTKSELSGVGEEEFAPWIIGPVMSARRDGRRFAGVSAKPTTARR